MNIELNRIRALSNQVGIEDFVRCQQCTSKSVYSENMSCEAFGNRNQQKLDKSKDISEMRDTSEKRNHSRLANDQVNSRLKCKKNSYKYHRSIDKSRREVRNDSGRNWLKESSINQTKMLRPSDLERENQFLLQGIVQKQKILKDLDKRIELKMSEWLLFEAEANRKMASYNNQLNSIAEIVKKEKLELNSVRLKIAESQQVFNNRCAEITRRKQQVQQLCKYVEQTTKDQDLAKTQFETEKNACQTQMSKFQEIKKQLQEKERKLEEASKRIHCYEEQVLETMSSLDKRQKQISDRQAQLTALGQKHKAKHMQLDQREKVIAAYVNQLNSCITTLTAQRSSLLNINTNLQRRCNQLQNLQMKLFRKLTDDPTNNELNRYLTDSTNIQSKTPVRKNKQNIITFTEKKGGNKKKEDRTTIIEENSSDLLSDSPLTFDFSNMN